MKINGVLFSDTDFNFNFLDYGINITLLSLNLENIKNNIFHDKDVIFLNLNNNNNLEYIKYIRRKNLNIPIIIIGQEIDFNVLKDYIHFGIFDYIITPFELDYFEYTMKRLIKTLSKNYIKDDKCLIDFYNDFIISDRKSILKNIKNIYFYGETEYIMEDLKTLLLYDFPWIEYYINIESYDNLENFIVEIHNISLKFNLHNKDNILNKICNCVFDNIESNKIFDKISENLELTKDYIGKIFKSQTKITVNEYIQHMKIGYSKKIIKEERLKIYEICEKIGYSSTDYFTKIFRKYTGETPTEYRKRILNM